ncbi:hypothetical protein FACS1894133_6810 [Clostridia bacterium]|nr:hypothetical protein FACS1894133_6810 [Clostridia bacterium]
MNIRISSDITSLERSVVPFEVIAGTAASCREVVVDTVTACVAGSARLRLGRVSCAGSDIVGGSGAAYSGGVFEAVREFYLGVTETARRYDELTLAHDKDVHAETEKELSALKADGDYVAYMKDYSVTRRLLLKSYRNDERLAFERPRHMKNLPDLLSVSLAKLIDTVYRTATVTQALKAAELHRERKKLTETLKLTADFFIGKITSEYIPYYTGEGEHGEAYLRELNSLKAARAAAASVSHNIKNAAKFAAKVIIASAKMVVEAELMIMRRTHLLIYCKALCAENRCGLERQNLLFGKVFSGAGVSAFGADEPLPCELSLCDFAENYHKMRDENDFLSETLGDGLEQLYEGDLSDIAEKLRRLSKSVLWEYHLAYSRADNARMINDIALGAGKFLVLRGFRQTDLLAEFYTHKVAQSAESAATAQAENVTATAQAETAAAQAETAAAQAEDPANTAQTDEYSVMPRYSATYTDSRCRVAVSFTPYYKSGLINTRVMLDFNDVAPIDVKSYADGCTSLFGEVKAEVGGVFRERYGTLPVWINSKTSVDLHL